MVLWRLKNLAADVVSEGFNGREPEHPIGIFLCELFKHRVPSSIRKNNKYNTDFFSSEEFLTFWFAKHGMVFHRLLQMVLDEGLALRLDAKGELSFRGGEAHDRVGIDRLLVVYRALLPLETVLLFAGELAGENVETGDEVLMPDVLDLELPCAFHTKLTRVPGPVIGQAE